jgi:hypothetical protein
MIGNSDGAMVSYSKLINYIVRWRDWRNQGQPKRALAFPTYKRGPNSSDTQIFLRIIQHPPHHATMPPHNAQMEEDALADAIHYSSLNPHLKLTQVAKEKGVKYHKLCARKLGQPPSHTRGGQNKKLSEPQDNALQDYLLLLYHAGTPANLEVLILSANRLLYYSGQSETVSWRWAKRWVTRNKEYWKTVKSKPIAVKRGAAHVKEDIEAHFKEFDRCKKKWGIHNDDISNFDESGFQIGVTFGDKVLIPTDAEAAFIDDPENRELVTVVATLNYGGKKIPPMIIYKGAYHLRKYFVPTMDGDTLYASSESGFTNDHLGMSYLRHFDKFTKDSTKGAYRLLIFDGHGSHLNQDFVDFCWTHNIRPFQLIPHLTHVLQPADIGFFQVLKYNFKKALRQEVFMGAQEISKVDFFLIFQTFWDKTMKVKTIQSSFRKTELIPLDPSIVLKKLKIY